MTNASAATHVFHAPRAVARLAPTVARILLGLILFVFGLNGFLNFLPKPTAPMSEQALAFIGGLMGAGYMFPLIKGTEVIVGALLLANRFVPLALVVIFPIVVNIVAFHVLLAPSGAALVLVMLAIELFLAWTYRSAYRPMLHARNAPSASS